VTEVGKLSTSKNENEMEARHEKKEFFKGAFGLWNGSGVHHHWRLSKFCAERFPESGD
jgi:hypothetical protein